MADGANARWSTNDENADRIAYVFGWRGELRGRSFRGVGQRRGNKILQHSYVADRQQLELIACVDDCQHLRHETALTQLLHGQSRQGIKAGFARLWH